MSSVIDIFDIFTILKGVSNAEFIINAHRYDSLDS